MRWERGREGRGWGREGGRGGSSGEGRVGREGWRLVRREGEVGAGEGGRGTPIASPTRVQSGRYIFSVANCSHTEGELESRPVPTPTPGRRPRPAEPARALSRTALRRANLKVRPCPRRMRPRTKGGRRRGPRCQEGWRWWKGWRRRVAAQFEERLLRV